MFSGYMEGELAAGLYVTRHRATAEQKRELWRAIQGLLDFAVMGAVILIGVVADQLYSFGSRSRHRV